MKHYPTHRLPKSAALYLRNCQNKKNSAACKRLDLFERLCRVFALSIAGIASLVALTGVIQIALILSK